MKVGLTYTTPRLMRAQTAILFLRESVKCHTTAIGSSVHTTSAKTETAAQNCQQLLVDYSVASIHTCLKVD